jgi:predicted KAP-like P-loop ATPase
VPNLISDRPIASESEDALGLISFADALAKSLAEMAPDDGIVIAIQGEWGSGKTSAIELAQQRLIVRELARERNTSISEIEQRNWSVNKSDWDSISETRRTQIVRFNPWNFSGHENLVRAFFSEIGATIGHPPDGPIDKAIRKITDNLTNAGTILGGAIGGAATGGVAIGAGATLGRAAGEGVQRLIGKATSLESAKKELAEALRQSGKRIVVIVDDLDRLLPSEMRAMFSVVKSLGDLPNILYVWPAPGSVDTRLS